METPPPIPRAARTLGYAGLLPLAACAAGIVLLPMHRAMLLEAGFGYAALIYSFLGGLWWGQSVALGHSSAWRFAVAVFPSLIAWGLMLLLRLGWTMQAALFALALAILLSPAVDLVLSRRQPTAPGWISLRLRLSAGLSLLTLGLAAL